MAKGQESEAYYEQKIKKAAQGQDPLAPYIEYHAWFKASFPKKRKEQAVIVSRAIRLFREDERYQQDNRFVQFCILYANFISNSIEFLEFMENKNIGTEWALFYEAKSLLHEKKGCYEDASRCFLKGIENNARPLPRLKSNYEKFCERWKTAENRPSSTQPSAPSTRKTDATATAPPPVAWAGQSLPQKASETTLQPKSALSVAPDSTEMQYEELRAQLYYKQQEALQQKRRQEAQERAEKQRQEEERQRAEATRRAEEARRAEEEAQRLAELKRKLQAQREEEQRRRQEEERARQEAERRKRQQEEEEKERQRQLEEERQRQEAERQRQLEMRRRQEEEERQRQLQRERQEQERQRQLRLEQERRQQEEAERARREEEERRQEEERRAQLAADQMDEEAFDVSARLLDLSDSEDGSDQGLTEELERLSFTEGDTDVPTVVIDEDNSAFTGAPTRDERDLLTRSGSTSMFNILDRTSNLNGTIHTTSVFAPDRTVTFYTKKAEQFLQNAFNCPLSDSDEEDSEEESDEEEDTHIHGFTGHIAMDPEEDPLAALNDLPHGGGFTICQDATGPLDIPGDDSACLLLNESQQAPLHIFHDENQPHDAVLQDLPIESELEHSIEILTEPATHSGSHSPLSLSGEFEIYRDPSEKVSALFSGPLDDSEDEESSESEVDKENHPHAAPMSVYESPRPLEVDGMTRERSKSVPFAVSPFAMYHDPENTGTTEELFDLSLDRQEASPAHTHSSGFQMFQDSPVVETKSAPRSNDSGVFSVFQDSDQGESEVDVFQMHDDSEANSEDIFDLSDLESSFDCAAPGTIPFLDDDSEEEEVDLPTTQPIVFATVEIAQVLHLSEPINPYTHQHSKQLQALPVFRNLLEQYKSDELYARRPYPAPTSQHLQSAPRRMRANKFTDQDFIEFPLFEKDKRAKNRKSVFTLGPCIGSGGFAKVFLGHHFFETCAGDDTMAVAADTRRALKYQHHEQDPWAIRWEFYIMQEIQKRMEQLWVEKHTATQYLYQHEYLSSRLCSAMCLREFTDSSFLMLSYLDQGTLLDLINAHRSKNRKIDEGLIAFLTLEILSILYALHQCHIIHGDIKPDNFLFMNETAPNGATWEEWQPHGEASWKLRGLQLIDYGRSLDLRLYGARGEQLFVGDNHVREYQSVEMKKGLPWSYHLDLYGACAIVHLLLHLAPMEVVEKVPSKKFTPTAPSCVKAGAPCHLPKETFKRYWAYNWEQLFADLLHVPPTQGPTYCQTLLEKHIASLQSFVASQSKKIRVSLSKEHQLMHDQGY